MKNLGKEGEASFTLGGPAPSDWSLWYTPIAAGQTSYLMVRFPAGVFTVKNDGKVDIGGRRRRRLPPGRREQGDVSPLRSTGVARGGGSVPHDRAR